MDMTNLASMILIGLFLDECHGFRRYVEVVLYSRSKGGNIFCRTQKF